MYLYLPFHTTDLSDGHRLSHGLPLGREKLINQSVFISAICSDYSY